MEIERIKPNLMVHAKGKGFMEGTPGIHIGTVDHLEGNDWIKLKKNDAKDGRHHWIPVNWVEGADDKAIYLNKTVEEVARGMVDEVPVPLH